MCNSWLRIDTCSHLNGTSLVESFYSQQLSASFNKGITYISDHSNCGTKLKFCQSLWLHKVQERCFKEIKKHGWKFPGTTTVKTGKDRTEVDTITQITSLQLWVRVRSDLMHFRFFQAMASTEENQQQTRE